MFPLCRKSYSTVWLTMCVTNENERLSKDGGYDEVKNPTLLVYVERRGKLSWLRGVDPRSWLALERILICNDICGCILCELK